MSAEAHSVSLLSPVVLLAAAVIAVPLFKRVGLGSVLGYLIAGLAIGPFGLAFFTDSGSILQIAELGIVMYLFVIGLEMRQIGRASCRERGDVSVGDVAVKTKE